GDLAYLLLRDRSNLVPVRLAGTLVEPSFLLEEHRSRRRLQDESEALVGINRYFDRKDRILSLRSSVELLAERHDVDPLRTQCGSYRGSRRRLPCRNLQLDESGDLLCHFPSSGCDRRLTRQPWTTTSCLVSSWLSDILQLQYSVSGRQYSVSLQLQVIQFHARGASEQRHRHSHLSLVRHHFLHRTVEVRERTLGDLDSLTDKERNFFLGLLDLRLVGDTEQSVDLVCAKRHWRSLVPHELQYTLNGIDHVGRFLVPAHFHQDISGKELPLHGDLLPVLYLDHFLHRHQCLANGPLFRFHRISVNPSLDQRANLVLVPCSRLDSVPAVLHVHAQPPAKSAGSHCMNTARNEMSMIAITPPTMSDRTTTPIESWRTCARSGHVTFFISATTSR